MRKIAVQVGDRFGQWQVIGEGEKDRRGDRRLRVRCDCAARTEKLINLHVLRSGRSTSCGCWSDDKKRRVGDLRRKHGGRSDAKFLPSYRSWCAMKQRCLNPRAVGFSAYGGRGITICPDWIQSFEQFLKDVGVRPSMDHSLDRIDPNGDYKPGNVRWATDLEQNRNRRSNRLITIGDQCRTLSEWAALRRISLSTLFSRLERGWSPERALGLDQ